MIPAGKASFSSFLLAVLCFTCLFAVNPVAGQLPSAEQDPVLYFTSWEGSFLSWQRQGVATWIHDSEGNLRLEVMLGDEEIFPHNLYRILDWNGTQGWTVISVDSGGGTFSRWNEQWQELPEGLDTWMRVVVAESSGGLNLPASVRDISPGGRPLCLPFFSNALDRVAAIRLELPELTNHETAPKPENSSFRPNPRRDCL